MKATVALAVLQALAVQGIRIVQGNDDGWAELYTRSFHEALRATGHDVVLSCPAEDQSGKGSHDAPPKDRHEPCEYDSCPANSGPVGTNATRLDLNWVNSYPATAIKYGIDTFGPQLWDGAGPELAVAGPNVGVNLIAETLFSGTVGAADYAARVARIPAIAFSGAKHGRLRWDTSPVPRVSEVYAQLATNVTNLIVAGGAPYLPRDVFLNVNFPDIDNDKCRDAASVKFVLTRIYPGLGSAPDVNWCGRDRLPQEALVIFEGGCHASISIGDALDKTDMNDLAKQTFVLNRLKSILTCWD